MNIEEIKTEANRQLIDALDAIDLGGHFEVVPGALLSDESDIDEYVTIEYDIVFEYGNCEHKHAILIGWNEVDGVGLETGEDGDVYHISSERLTSSMYFDLALKGLEDQYID